MNEYEAKQEEKKQRYADRAVDLRAESNKLYERARQLGSIIPFGQPILVGHHSEGRDRRFRASISRKYEQAYEASQKADYYAQKAASVGTGGISSDDPDAIDKLRAKLAGMEANQALMVAANKIIRKFFNKRDLTDKDKLRADMQATLPSLMELGLTEDQAVKLFMPDFAGRRGYAQYNLTNNNGNMARVRERIAQLESKAQDRAALAAETGGEAVRAEECNGMRIEQNADENRVLLFFPGKPSEAIRTACKRNGFRWSPTRLAWSRQLSNGAIYAADCVKAAWLAEQSQAQS